MNPSLLFALSYRFFASISLSFLFSFGWALDFLDVHHLFALSPWRLVVPIYFWLAYIILTSSTPYLTFCCFVSSEGPGEQVFERGSY